MFIKKLTVATVAALGLSLGAYSASAGPVNGGIAPVSLAPSPSTFTLIRGAGGGGGGGHGGGGGMGGMGGGGHMGGAGFGGGHMGGGGGPGLGGRGYYSGGTAFYRPGIAGSGRGLQRRPHSLISR